ncbi:MAG: FAD-binding protein [Acidobacteriaceae bacterium]|nr:FAD-binding protein [Acidobacteriaceae bacterium]
MDKRTFLKFLSGAATYSLGSFIPAEGAQVKLTNWAGNVEYSTDKLSEPRTVDQVRERVKAEPRLKVLGSRHCFNRIADSRYQFISLKSLPDEISLDAGARTVSVNPAITYGRLAPYLTEKGFALHNLASLPHISVAGACATGTHGSGEKNGNLPTAVTALELVNARGDLVRLSEEKDGDTFRGTVVGLGALGVVTRMTLKLQPTFQMRQYVYENMSVDHVKAHFDAIQSSAYSVSLFTNWQNHSVSEVWVKCRQGDKMYDGPAEFFGAKRATKNLHPIENLSAENCTEQMGVPGPWYERLPHFRMGFTPSAGKELQTEYLLPRRHAVEAYLAVERLGAQISPHLLISEIRTMAADELWMSPAYRRPTVAIHFTWQQDWPAVSKLLPVIERELGPFQPRPHWGKLFTVPHSQLAARYERMPDFIDLCRRFDAQGKFRNDFLNTNLFA